MMNFFYFVASPSIMVVKFGVSLMASQSGCIMELTKEPMGLEVMLESRPVVMLPGGNAAETRQSPDQWRNACLQLHHKGTNFWFSFHFL